MDLLNKFQNIALEIFLIFLSASIILFGYPLIIVLIFPCWIYKKLAVNQAQQDPKTGNILEGIDALLANKDPYGNPIDVRMPVMSLAGKLDVPTVIKVLEEKVITPNLYPELSQKIVQKYGYNFWYSVDNFKVENHVHYLKPECPNMPLTRPELRDIIINKLGVLPFDSSMSPWEILVVPNMIDDRDPEVKSVFILRVHHCLMDGYSMTNFIKKLAFKPWKMLGGENTEEKKRTCKFVEVYEFIILLLTGPYHLLKMFQFSNDRHQFVQNTLKPDFKEIYNSQCTPKIPDIRLKSVKNAYGVTMSSLITTLFAQATWKSMKRVDILVPSTIHGFLSIPIPGHRDVLYNHWSLVSIVIKVDKSDPRNTLKSVEKEFQSLRNSVKPLVFFYGSKLVALVPFWFKLISMIIRPRTFILVNFPGPTEPSDMFGYTIKDFNAMAKSSQETSFLLGSYSHAGDFLFEASGPVCNLPTQQDADFVTKSIMDTLAYLEAEVPKIAYQK